MFRGLFAPALALLAMNACGYRPIYGGPTDERLSVVLIRSLVANSGVTDDVVRGVRARLVRDGAFRSGSGYPRIEVEVLRIDESAEAIGVASTVSGLAPRAGALSYGVVARAWLRRDEHSEPERDTGDLRALSHAGVDENADGPNSRSALLDADAAWRASAYRTGERLALRIMGFAVPEGDGRDGVP